MTENFIIIQGLLIRIIRLYTVRIRLKLTVDLYLPIIMEMLFLEVIVACLIISRQCLLPHVMELITFQDIL